MGVINLIMLDDTETKSTITITYGESVENHVGNQQIGDIAENGVSVKKLKELYKLLKDKYKCKLINLNKLLPEENKSKDKKIQSASILIVKDFVNNFFDNSDNSDGNGNTKTTEIFNKLKKLKWDKKVKMRGKVVNKHARYNICFGDFSQKPDYENGKGIVYDFKKQPDLSAIRNYLSDILGLGDNKLNAEGNYYYDTEKCYIGFHGDISHGLANSLTLANAAQRKM